MKCKAGICLVCEKPIVQTCITCGNLGKAVNYTEIQLRWSNGSMMQTPVCRECSVGPVWQADKTALTQAIWSAWDELGARYDKEIVIVG